jgi:hypothetical protein
MALEIRELLIKVTIDNEAAAVKALPDDKHLRQWKENIIKECIENILKRIRVEADR